MRKRLVFWGRNEQEEKVLIALALEEETSDVNVYIFAETQATEEFATDMMKKWRVGEDLAFPENHIETKRPLSITESLLPDGYEVERDDILKRAQTEWQFVVLSAKLYKSYKDELEEFKEKIKELPKFENQVWEDLKGFWSKVQEQVREKNLFRDHANGIREHTNQLFDQLKTMRKDLDQEFNVLSQKHAKHFKEKLDEIEKKVEDGLSLQPIFQELKDIQRNFRDTKFTREHRSQVWKKLDGLFKTVKEKRFGSDASGRTSPAERLKRRYQGLLNAIEKMNRSIDRDKRDLKFQNDRINDTDGSLEAQLRAAKTTMIEERIRSKEEKLAEMKKTQSDLEKRMESLKRKEEKMKAEKKVEEAKEAIKEKIAQDIREAEAKRSEDDNILKAAEAIKDSTSPSQPAEKKGSMTLIETIEDGMEDVVDTIKAVAFVIEQKVESAIEEWKEEEE